MHKKIYVYTATILNILLLFGLCLTAHAGPGITDKQAVQCILGEARSQGYAEMLGIAEVLRRRGSIRGVYGCGVDFSREMPYIKAKKIDAMAALAWANSAHTDTAKGATHWEGTAFKTPYWAKNMIKTVTIGKTNFYREGRK